MRCIFFVIFIGLDWFPHKKMVVSHKYVVDIIEVGIFRKIRSWIELMQLSQINGSFKTFG